MSDRKKKILLDLDGVLNNYKGNYTPDTIPSIKDGAKDFLEKLSQNYEIKIFTVRDVELTKKWVIQNNIQVFISGVTNTKEPCWLIADDRCVSFNGCYDKLLSDINSFKVWYKD